MLTTLKKGSRGEEVKELQGLLGLTKDGSFGPGTEEAVKRFQRIHNLKDDGVVGEKTWDALMGIIPVPISKHVTRVPRRIKYLVIHYTAGASSMKGSARKERDGFTKDRAASADYCVDDKEIILVNPDTKNYYCWTVGDGNGKNGITNANSISIEICSNLVKGTSAKEPNHEGWTFTDASLDNAVRLARYLMKKHDIDINHVVRHYDASGKCCPGVLGWNDGALYTKYGTKTTQKNNSQKWLDFKRRLV